MMKSIVLFTDILLAGGAQRQLVGLATLLKKRGFRVLVVTYYPGSSYNEILEQSSIPHIVLSCSKNFFVRYISLLRFVKKHNVQTLIAFQTRPAILACLLKVLVPTLKIIVSERNTSQKYGSLERISFNVYRLARFVVPNSYSQGYFINNHAPYLNKKNVVITNFVDTSFFVPNFQKKQRDKIRILIIARITPQKNTINFIKAVKEVTLKEKKLVIDWFGYIQGDGSYYKQCVDVIKDQGLSDVFFFHQPKKNILEEYQNTDFFCLPSIYEGTPNVLLEAMSCGLPILCSDVCDNSRYILNNGWLFNPLDVADISNTILKALKSSDEEINNMKESSRDMAIKILSPDSFVNKYIELLNN